MESAAVVLFALHPDAAAAGVDRELAEGEAKTDGSDASVALISDSAELLEDPFPVVD